MPALQPEQFTLDTVKLNFEPVSVINGLATYTGQFSLIPEGGGAAVPIPIAAALAPTMTMSLQKPSKTSRISKTRVKIVIPEPVLVNGVATTAKDHENSIDITVMSSERALPAERARLVEIATSLAYKSTYIAVAVDGKSIY